MPMPNTVNMSTTSSYITAGTISGPYPNINTGVIASGVNYTSAVGASSVNWAQSASASLQVSGDAKFEGSVTIKGVDIFKLLESIQDRLAILVPDPEKLEKYQALRKAYDHYKLLETLVKE
jgi:hypothetical protein